MKVKEFNKWFEARDYLEGSRMLQINENPLSLVIGFIPEDNINDDLLDSVNLIPFGVTFWDYKPEKNFIPSANTKKSLVEINESNSNQIELTFSFKSIKLICKEIQIESLEK